MYALRRVQNENGQTMAEYALVVGVMITAVILLTFGFLSGSIAHAINTAASLIP
jgi:Flp pilus assembly pilin Flp